MRIRIKKLNCLLSQKKSYEHRYLDCDHYEKCLNKAFEKNWVSFSCIKCPRFKAYKARLEKEIEEKGEADIGLISGGMVYDRGIYRF